MNKHYLSLLSALLFLFLAGCASNDSVVDTTLSAQSMYSIANNALIVGKYTKAVKYYEALQATYPFGDYAQQALLEESYAQYKNDQPDIATANLDRFIRIYPLNKHLDYAVYLRGLINFNRNVGLVEKYVPRDESQRDPASVRKALRDFDYLIKRFPQSQYVPDSKQRIIYLRNRLAKHEIDVATYYMRRSSYIAAANRAKYVIDNYERTPAIPEALTIMAKSYKILGLNQLSTDALKVLKLNYPNYDGIKDVEDTTVK